MSTSPAFSMSSCLISGLDIISRPSSPSSSSSHSSPLSTLSESSTSTPLSISTKRGRAPRKRPNQRSAEAAALLSTISPKLFSPSNLQQTNYFPVLLPSFPIPDDAALLLREPPAMENKISVRFKPKMPVCSPPFFQFQDPGSPDFDAESILDEGVEENIESVLGMRNLSVSPERENGTDDCLMGFGGFRFGLGILSNMRRALKRSDDGEWWSSPVVAVKDIVPKSKEQTLMAKKKKKKKEKVEREEDMEGRDFATSFLLEDGISKPQLGLKLNYDGVMKEWSGNSPFTGEADTLKCSANVIARLANIDLFSDGGCGVTREASIQRYKEKRRNRFFSKKISYQVRKANADRRPRMKGRFFSNPSFLLEAKAEERKLVP